MGSHSLTFNLFTAPISNKITTQQQHGRDGNERDEALRHQQPELGRRGEAEVAAAPGPPAVREPLPARDHHRGHPLHQAPAKRTWKLQLLLVARWKTCSEKYFFSVLCFVPNRDIF